MAVNPEARAWDASRTNLSCRTPARRVNSGIVTLDGRESRHERPSRSEEEKERVRGRDGFGGCRSSATWSGSRFRSSRTNPPLPAARPASSSSASAPRRGLTSGIKLRRKRRRSFKNCNKKISATQFLRVNYQQSKGEKWTVFPLVPRGGGGQKKALTFDHLFHFDVHENVRTIADATIEKDESHAGKVVERHRYEKNKHILPASIWEIYDPTKKWDRYTIPRKWI
ncbi:uncharacterized protein [Elaeis guineensis]|uniref:uncharacterized protein n=1 Tax=Elaeis guineensis var. tenera TaxID=51953 RepID=UPI003C6D1716